MRNLWLETYRPKFYLVVLHSVVGIRIPVRNVAFKFIISESQFRHFPARSSDGRMKVPLEKVP